MTAGLKVLAAVWRGEACPCQRTSLAGVDVFVARPPTGAGPVVVYANAAAPLGIAEPFVRRFLGALAWAGFVAIGPELPRVRDGEVTPLTLEALVAVAEAVGRRVALLGLSTGGGLAILAAADPLLAPRVSSVAAIAPFASLKNVLRLGTTGFYADRPYAAAPLVARAAARSLTACAPEDAAVPTMLANRDPRRFDALYAQLEPGTRSLIRELSPEAHIGRVLAPVELATGFDDRFFPAAESKLLARAGRDVSLIVTSALEHVRPRPRPGLALLAGLLTRTLERVESS